jgi:6-pyruvoyltetrahydropterin/6-carboxytetrahydropterin synthase
MGRMPYRVCKSFYVESGHMLSKHPGLCRFPHGHSRRIDVVLVAPALDAQEMVCDFKALKLAVKDEIDRLDHALVVNSKDPHLPALSGVRDRVVVYQDQDPTTEVMAKRLYDHIDSELRAERTYVDERGHSYRFPPGVRVERVRVTETATTWAEFGVD